MSEPLAPLARALLARQVRYLLIGVSAANLYAPPLLPKFVTDDWDLFLPTDPDNLALAWAACDDIGAELWVGGEPLDRPHDRWLAERVVGRRALTRATVTDELTADLTLVMQGFNFDEAWKERRLFVLAGVDVPTARLSHIVLSKHATGRDKDKLFLATHKDALEELLKRGE